MLQRYRSALCSLETRTLLDSQALCAFALSFRSFCEKAPSVTKAHSKGWRGGTAQQKFERKLRRSFNLEKAKASETRTVFAAVAVERYPICLPDPTPWKVEHTNWSSVWNRWKYRNVSDEAMSGDKANVDELSAEATFVPEPVITEADRDNDIRSLRRNTQGYLYLACKYSLEDDAPWEFPRVRVGKLETLRDAAKRCVAEMSGTSIETYFFGNSPAAHVESADGETYLMLGSVLDGDVRLPNDSSVMDFAWLTKKELKDGYRDNERMLKVINTWLEE